MVEIDKISFPSKETGVMYDLNSTAYR